jgi:hypothetical protein
MTYRYLWGYASLYDTKTSHNIKIAFHKLIVTEHYLTTTDGPTLCLSTGINFPFLVLIEVT